MSAARKLRRRAHRVTAFPPEDVELINEVFEVAGQSLGIEPSQLDAIERAGGEQADVLLARVIELIELTSKDGLHDYYKSMRETLEQRNGSGFLERVAAIGVPASEALSSHNIQSRKLVTPTGGVYHLRPPWIRSKRSFASSGRRSAFRWGSPIGRARGRSNFTARGSRLSSCFAGGNDGFASGTSRLTIRSSRSSVATVRSRSRRTLAADLR